MYANTGLEDRVIEALIFFAKRYQVKKLVLFGSRARGNYMRASDIDLAVYGGNLPMFRLDVMEEVPTLLQFDFVDVNAGISDQLLKEIQKGVILYEEV